MIGDGASHGPWDQNPVCEPPHGQQLTPSGNANRGQVRHIFPEKSLPLGLGNPRTGGSPHGAAAKVGKPMKSPVERIRPATAAEWDALWRECEHATFFQSRGWAEVWERATRGRVSPNAKCVLFRNGAMALLPLSIEHKPLGPRTVSSPAATYGGWLTTHALGGEETDALAQVLLGESRDLFWKLNPFDPTVSAIALPPTEPDDTQVLDLASGFEAIRRGWTKGHRAAATQAFRAGVEVRLANGAPDWNAYFELYEDSLRRWGSRTLTRHPRALFDELRTLASPDVRLWLAEHEGEPVAGALCFAARRHLVYWHGAARESALSVRPVHALIHEIVRQACDEGAHTWFDFNPSGPLDGVRAFKQGFGARTLACPNVRLQPAWLRLARRCQAALTGN